MAIKLSGNTVIDDSKNVLFANTITATSFTGSGAGITNLPLPDALLKPTNTLPADGATDVSYQSAVICGSQYFSLYGKTHTCSCFQVSECSDFSTCNVFTCEIAGAVRGQSIPSGCLSPETQHFFRVRYEDSDGCCTSFSDATCFTTAADPFDALGNSVCGGYYMGTVCAASTCYYLIMAPNATGCANACQYRDNTSGSAATCFCDGYGNTYNSLANSSHPAGNWTATRSIGGFTDWYLPARCEIKTLFDNRASAPAGEGFPPQDYWSSTDGDNDNAYYQNFSSGGNLARTKTATSKVRAIRRVAFP